MQFGQKEAEGRGLHGRLNGHGPALNLGKVQPAGDEVASQAAHEVQQQDGDLQLRASGQNCYRQRENNFFKQKKSLEINLLQL